MRRLLQQRSICQTVMQTASTLQHTVQYMPNGLPPPAGKSTLQTPALWHSFLCVLPQRHVAAVTPVRDTPVPALLIPPHAMQLTSTS
jgi:hypothetical protein